SPHLQTARDRSSPSAAPMRRRVSRSSSEESVELKIVVGPTRKLPGRLGVSRRFQQMSRRDIISRASCSSTENCIRLSDYLRMRPRAAAGGELQPVPELSFGSALHVGDGVNALCLVCSYHKPPLRTCTKGAFCDFCHLHDGRRNRRRRNLRDESGRMVWADTEVQILEGIRL
ncbi:bst1, partial [Symbiodinium sp. CCMP2456]